MLNCVRLLTRILPFLFEAPDWRLLFWSPANFIEVGVESESCHYYVDNMTSSKHWNRVIKRVQMNMLVCIKYAVKMVIKVRTKPHKNLV